MSSGDNIRLFRRFRVEGLRGYLTVPIAVEVLDLSLGGVALESRSYLQFGRHYHLDLEYGDRVLSMVGIVAWCKLMRTERNRAGEVEPIYRAGLRFLVEKESDLAALWEVLRGQVSAEPNERVFERFEAGFPRIARLDSNYAFSVTNLSLSGMLIETDFVPDLDARLEIRMSLQAKLLATLGRIASVPSLGRRAAGELTQVGVEFCDLSQARLGVLQSYLAAYLDDGRPPLGRPPVEDASRPLRRS